MYYYKGIACKTWLEREKLRFKWHPILNFLKWFFYFSIFVSLNAQFCSEDAKEKNKAYHKAKTEQIKNK